MGGLFWQIPYILLTVPVFIVGCYFHHRIYQKKISKLASEREGLDVGTFAKSFDYRNIDTWIIRAVYEQLQKYVSTDETILPILPGDHLFNDLEIDEEDLEENLMEEISQRTGRSFEDIEKNPYYENLNTVSDLVHLFQNQPFKKGTGKQQAYYKIIDAA